MLMQKNLPLTIGRPGRCRPDGPRVHARIKASGWLALALVPWLIGAGPGSENDKDKSKDKPRTGEQIYRQMCASCHGASGEGTDDH